MVGIVDFSFNFLPDSEDAFIVLCWGRVINDLTGDYKIQVILNKLREGWDGPNVNVHDYKLDSLQVEVIATLGVIRALGPGTIVQKKKIIKFINEYRREKSRLLDIADAQNFELVRLGQLTDDFTGRGTNILKATKGYQKYFNAGDSMGKVPAHLFVRTDANGREIEKVLIPCGVLIDYYFFGRPKLIRSILSGKIDRTDKKLNSVYDPKKVTSDISPDNKRLAYLRLEKDMFDVDAFKIGRLAHDHFFWNTCNEINKAIVANPDAYLQCGVPVTGSSKLLVYGREIETSKGKFYYVYKVIKCSSAGPFDGLIISRDNPGWSTSDAGSKHLENGNNALTIEVNGPAPPKPKKKIKFKNGDTPKNVSDGNAHWQSVDEEVDYENVEINNFDSDLIIKEEILVGNNNEPQPSAPKTQFFEKFGQITFTTTIDKTGNGPTVRISLGTSAPAKPTPRPTNCFDMIKAAINLLLDELRSDISVGHLNNVNRCPIPHAYNEYSAFTVSAFQEKKDEEKKKFCYMEIKKNRYSIYRSIFISEININKNTFYVLDVQPKYRRTVKNDKDEVVKVGLATRSAVIFDHPVFSDESLKTLLIDIVEEKGLWSFLEKKYGNYRRLRHTTEEKLKEAMISFIKSRMKIV